MLLKAYAKLLYKCPGPLLAIYIVLLLLICIGLTLVAVFTTDAPDFTNPTAGFVTRGTPLSNRLLALQRLRESVASDDGLFSQLPEAPSPRRSRRQGASDNSTLDDDGVVGTANESTTALPTSTLPPTTVASATTTTTTTVSTRTTIQRTSTTSGRTSTSTSPTTTTVDPVKRQPVFCPRMPNASNWQLVIEVADVGSAAALRALCEVERRAYDDGLLTMYDVCERPRDGATAAGAVVCCQPWHAASLLAYVQRAVNCSELDTARWNATWTNVLRCARLRTRPRAPPAAVDQHDDGIELPPPPALTLSGDCDNPAMRMFLRYFVPLDLPGAGENNYTSMLLPLPQHGHSLVDSRRLTVGQVDRLPTTLSTHGARVVAAQFGLSDYFFKHHLRWDCRFLALSLVVVLLALLLYTRACVYSLAAMVSGALALGVTYFVYRVALGLSFFPISNVLVVALIVAVAVEQALLLRRAWLDALRDAPPDDLQRVLELSLSHALVSALVTSLVAAAALFAAALSRVAAVRALGICGGVGLLVNYLLLLLFLPPVLLLLEKSGCSRCLDAAERGVLARVGDFVSGKALSALVLRPRWLWIVLFAGVGILAAIAVLYEPGVALPQLDRLQQWRASHPFERFEADFADAFEYQPNSVGSPLVMHVVWGVEPVVDARALQPADEGTLEAWPQSRFQLADNLNLLWLHEFCKNMSRADFTWFEDDWSLEASCFSDGFMDLMSRKCGLFDPLSPCCRKSRFPYDEGIVADCLPSYADERMDGRYEKPGDFNWAHDLSGPLFIPKANLSSNESQFRGVVLSFVSRHNRTTSFAEMDQFYRTANRWVNEQLRQGPAGVRGGWFVADYTETYDVQRELVRGLGVTVAVAVAAAFVVLVVATLNPLVALLTCVSALVVVAATVAGLVLLRWQLNMLESALVVLAVALAFDYSLHYAVAFSLSDEAERGGRVRAAVRRVGSPLFAAAATCALAGAALVCSATLPLHRVGVLLALVALVSWLVGTLFLCALLGAVGPGADCCQAPLRGWGAAPQPSVGARQLRNADDDGAAADAAPLMELTQPRPPHDDLDDFIDS